MKVKVIGYGQRSMQQLPAVANKPAQRNRDVDRAWWLLPQTTGRASKLGCIVDGPVNHAVSVHLVELSRWHVSTIDIRNKIFYVRSLGTSSRGKYPHFGDTRDRSKEAAPMPNLGVIHSTVSIEHRLVTDRRTDRHTHTDTDGQRTIASITLRG